MFEFLGLSSAQLAALGTGAGVFLAALITAYRGFKAKMKEPVNAVPMAAIPPDLDRTIDEMANRVAHIERKVDECARQIAAIYVDTQVLRAKGR